MEEDEERAVKEADTENKKEETINNKNEIQSTQIIQNNKAEIIEEKVDKKTKNKHKKENNNFVKNIIIIIFLITTLLVLSTIFAILNVSNSNIIKGVYIENIELSNLNREQAAKLVKDKITNIEDIELCYGAYNTVVKLEELGVEISSKEAINNAINLGKKSNIIINNYSILKTNLFKTKFELEIKIDEQKFNSIIKNIQAEIPEAIKEYSYEIKGDKLIITNGKSGEKIIKDELKVAIISNIREQFNGNITSINVSTKIEEPEAIDILKIYNEIYKEAKNAYIIDEPFELHKEESGIDFGITIEEVKELLKENKETYTIPLKIKDPEIKVKDLGEKLFKQTLAKYTTIYDGGATNRAHNISLAAKTINGTILLPGETFSYNGTLGNTTKEKGYKIGTAYVGGKVVESYGGGICQVTSTLYNSVLYSNLEIVERYNHSYVVGYVPAGRDATVAYGGKDFKFKNNRKYPIKIEASAKNGVVSVSIKGIKEDTDYVVELTSTVLSTTKRSVVYEENSSMVEGTQKVIQNGYDGKKSIAYKILKNKDGTIHSKTVLSKDTYKPMSKIIQVGTKKVATEVIVPPMQNTVITDQNNTIDNSII